MYFRLSAIATYIGILFLLPHTVAAQWFSNFLLYTEVCTAPNDQYNSTLVSDGRGGTFVVWMDDRVWGWPQNLELYLQRINRYGYKEFAPSGIRITDSVMFDFYHAAIPGRDNGVLVAHEGYGGWGSRICLHSFDSSGTELWVRKWVLPQPHFEGTSFQIVSDGNGGAYISQYFPRYVNNDPHLYDGGDVLGQWIDYTGNNRWPANGLEIAVHDSIQSHPVMIEAPNGGFYIAWADDVHFEIDSLFDLRVQKVDTSGTLLWGAQGVLLTRTRLATSNYSLTKNDSGGVMACWVDGKHFHFETSVRSDDSMMVLAQYVSDSGKVLWDSSAVEVSAGMPMLGMPDDEIRIIQSVKSTQGRTIITWYVSGERIYAQSIDRTGIRVFPGGLAQLVANPGIGNLSTYGVIEDGNGGALISTLQGTSTTPSGLFSTKIESDGQVAWKDRRIKSGLRIPSIVTNYKHPHIIRDGKDGYILTWTQESMITQSLDIYIDRLNSIGYSLPVEFISFSGVLHGNTALLRWTTANELNNSHFTLQRSVGENWSDRGIIAGIGQAASPEAYAFSDDITDIPPSVLDVFYRVLQSDYNGTTVPSPIIKLSRSTNNTISQIVEMYPQPTSNTLNVTLTFDTYRSLSISIVDQLGRLRQSYQYPWQGEGTHLYQLNLSPLPTGIYHVRISWEGGAISRTIMKQ